MGVTRTDLFSNMQNELALMARVLGHPAHIAILEHLLKLNSCINSDLVNELGLAQATISQHLKELKNIGLIKGTVEGTSMCYCIDSEKWTTLKNQFSTFFDQLAKPGDCC
tara:strand:+ start:276 stop:605 length:330 start_codon:yes stop_codon:yes gene_type:complete